MENSVGIQQQNISNAFYLWQRLYLEGLFFTPGVRIAASLYCYAVQMGWRHENLISSIKYHKKRNCMVSTI